MEKEIPGLSERMSRVEGILEQMSDRLNHIETRMDLIENRMASEFTAVRVEMASHFRWTLALIITMWVTVIAAILFK